MAKQYCDSAKTKHSSNLKTLLIIELKFGMLTQSPDNYGWYEAQMSPIISLDFSPF